MKRRLFSPAGLALLALPAGKADRENQKRRQVKDLGSVTASQALFASQIKLTGPIFLWGSQSRNFPLLRELVKQGSPYVLVGTERDLDKSCLLALPHDWTDTIPPDTLPPGSGILTLDSGDPDAAIQLQTTLPYWNRHLVILCLGNGLQADMDTMDILNKKGCYLILAESLSRSISSSGNIRLDETKFLRFMDCILISSTGPDTKAAIEALPTYESVRPATTWDLSLRRNDARKFGSLNRQDRDPGGLGLGQTRTLETKPVFTHQELTEARDRRATILCNAQTGHLFTCSIR